MKLKLHFRSSGRRAYVSSFLRWRTALNLSVLMATAAFPVANAQIGFTPSVLGGLGIGTSSNKASKVTSLQFGPDNRLYFTQVNGTVIICDVTRQGPNNYVASNVEIISLVKNIPNYDDDGTRNFTQTSRQCTGILVVGTAAVPVIYVTSCDPREGAGSGGTDLNLDTNSGMISRLSKNGSGVWEKVDIVRGLPRSEENHASNGLNISADGNTLYLAQGGNTNAGSPSANFAYFCETALSAAVISVNLPAINAMPVQTDGYGQQFIYNLPTLNDPNAARGSVSGNPNHADVNDPFGGNDGLNQAKLVSGGPVQVYASGFRNPYDILIAKTPGRLGKMYTFDNAANSGWGGYPKNESVPATVTNQYVSGEPGTVNNMDGLYLITGAGYYKGHPNPVRANPAGAGWLRNDENGAGIIFSASPTADWPPVPPAMADARQGDFKLPGPADGALITNSASTTGLAEYTASNFGGAMMGNIIVTQYSAKTVQRIMMNSDGTAVTGSSVLLNGDAYGTPLDVTCPGPGAAPALSGTIFVGHYSSKITILEPADFDSSGSGPCSGTFSFTLDDDRDGYSNADEISNNSDACSPAVTPPDNDDDFLSDMFDSDDDNDGVADTQDVFAIDALNGADVAAPVRRELFNELGIGFFGIGFKGVMLNPGEDYSLKIDDDELVAGGTAGLFTDPAVGPGHPHGAANTEMNAFHFGVRVDEFTGPFLASSGLGGLLFNGTPTAAQSQGIFIGNGDQDNYVKLAVNANSGAGAIEVVHEENGTIKNQAFHTAAGLFSDDVTLYFRIDPIAGTVHPGYSIGTGGITYVGSPLNVGGKIRDAIRGSAAMAFGLLATTGNATTPTFNATWDYFAVAPIFGTAAAKLTVNSGTGTIASSSTNTSGAFKLENLSTGGQKITSLKVDLKTALLPDIVFDPNHLAGDSDGKIFQVDSFNGTGTPTHTFESPHNGVNEQEGYNVIHVHCGSGVSFTPGKLLVFSSDIDPTNIRGVTGPGPYHAGSVSGLELIGATVTVTFDDGTVRKTRLGGIPGTTGANKGSIGVLSSSTLPTPTLSVPGKTSPFTTTSQPTVRVAGPAGAAVKVGVCRSALRLDDGILTVPNGGYDLDPYETNTVVSFAFIDAVIGTTGFVDVPLSLTYDQELGGIHLVSTHLVDNSGNRSASSDVLTIDYDPPDATPNALFRINAGAATSYTDTTGQVWSADSHFTSGTSLTYANAIAGTSDDSIYQSQRYDNSPSSPLDYNFAVANGTYQVRLHFAETWSGITAAGQRVFDVLLEGQTAVNDLDVFAVAGPNTAHVITLQSVVNDGQLTIGFRNVVQNPFICGIEVFQAGANDPDTLAPTAPGVLTYSQLQPGSLQLAWSQSTDNSGSVSGYRIYRDSLPAPIGDTTSLSLLVGGLMPSTQYTFGVEAYDTASNVSGRTTLTVTTPPDTQNPTPPGALAGTAGNGLAMLSWNASTDDTRIKDYRISRNGNLIDTVTELKFTDSGLTNGTLYQYSVVAVDVVGKVSAAATVSVRPSALGPAMYRVDCGKSSGSYTDTTGQVWSADSHFTSGTALTSANAIAGTSDDSIYQSQRYDNSPSSPLDYNFTVANGTYEVRLHFAETWSGITAVGQRVFDVLLEGQTAVNDLDVFAVAGANAAHVITLQTAVNDGQLTIGFRHVVQNPFICGIEIFQAGTMGADTLAPTAPGALTYSQLQPGGLQLAWTQSSDNSGNVSGYRIYRNSLPAPIGETTSLSWLAGGLMPSTQYTFGVEAYDAAGNVSVRTTLTVTTPPDALYRVDCGKSSGSYTDTTGQVWSADKLFTSGTALTYEAVIAGTSDDPIYHSYRYDNSPSSPLDYNFTVTNGTYQVRLHFAETWSGITAAGQRVFDVLLEGQTAVNDLDVFAVAGRNTAHVITLQSAVNDGQLTISFRHVVQNPLICGIEIYPVSGAANISSEQSLTLQNLASQITSDADRGGLLNLTEFQLGLAPVLPRIGICGIREWLPVRLAHTGHGIFPLHHFSEIRKLRVWQYDDDFELGFGPLLGDGNLVIHYPLLNPVGNYSLEMSDEPGGAEIQPRTIDFISRAQLEGMNQVERGNLKTIVPISGPRAYFRLKFESAP